MGTVPSARTTRAAASGRVSSTRPVPGLRGLGSRFGLESPLRTAAVCLLLVLVLGSALFHSQFIPFTLHLSAFLGFNAPQPVVSAETGAILFTPFDGNACRKVLFSNRTGRFGPDQQVRCDTGLPADREVAALRDVGPVARMNSIREAFTSRSTR